MIRVFSEKEEARLMLTGGTRKGSGHLRKTKLYVRKQAEVRGHREGPWEEGTGNLKGF